VAVTSLGLEIAITRPDSASGDTIMLTSLSQFQAQGWEKWLSRITFTRGTNSLKSNPIEIKSYPAITVLSPGSGYAFYLVFECTANANAMAFAIR
jgi:hypothetical protein